MKRMSAVLFCIALIFIAAGCSGDYAWDYGTDEGLEVTDMDLLTELYHIRIRAGDTAHTGFCENI